MANVSIVYPMYNVEKYIECSLKSILNQTYRDYELIAVNDGSADQTLELFNRIVEECEDPIEIQLINKKNGGLSDARNAGLQVAKGNWVVFVDSDDVIHPRYLEVLIGDAEKFEADLVIGSFKRVNESNLEEFSSVRDGMLIPRQKLMKLMLDRRRFDAYCGCFLINRRMLSKHNISFNKDVKFSVDQAFMWNLVDVAQRIAINYTPIYNYYVREGSIMTSSKVEQICSGVEHYKKVISALKNSPFDKDDVINRWKCGILHSASKIGSYEQWVLVRNRLDVNYCKCFHVPLLKIKIFAIIGLCSDKLLYKIFRKY